MVGNKNDLYQYEQVKKDEAERYAKSINASYKCVSALNSTGIQDLFESVAKTFLKRENGVNEEEQSEELKDKEFKLQPVLKEKKRRKGCC